MMREPNAEVWGTMNNSVSDRPKPIDRKWLRWAGIVWLVPVFIGQMFLADHIARTYLVAAARGDFAAWNKFLFVGIVVGDTVGNVMLIAHIFIAFAITLSGLFQFIPWLRYRAPAVHRWNGRFFIVIVITTAITSLWMIWTRDTFGGTLLSDLASSLNAVLMIGFCSVALLTAMRRQFAQHERWALRTFIVVQGVWFKRVLNALANMLPQKLPGLAPDMTGPTDVAINFASFLLPLAILEFYLWGRRSQHAAVVGASTSVLALAVLATAIGVYGVVARWLTGA
jgi:uncharacterized membrane protein